VYATKATDKLGWYKSHLQTSISWIEKLGLPLDAPVIDVGGGASTLVDDLLDAGYQSLTILDISEQALSAVRERLRKQSDQVAWLTADITAVELPADEYELWHDRAVFHFLTDPDDRRRYRNKLLTSLKPNGHVIIGTFAPEAPPKCSGLPVERYSLQQLIDEFGPDFELVDHLKELHITPGGIEQMYLFCHFRKIAEVSH
jgi:ubiquinone/menaquinone biosynthesis C-methylase UbiE